MRPPDHFRRPVLDLASTLGIAGSPRLGLRCPACGAERRDARRGAAGLTHDGMGWRCFKCGEGGDALDYAAWHHHGARYRNLTGPQKSDLRAVLGDEADTGSFRRVGDVLRRTMPALLRPPMEDLAGLWDRSLPLRSCWPGGGAAHGATADFLNQRVLSPLVDAIDAAGLARLTPPAAGGPWPDWWPRGRADRWRLLVRAWEPDGRLGSLHARSVEDGPGWDGQRLPKTLWPATARDGRAFAAGGLLFADAGAHALLRGEAAAEGPDTVLICEGLTDWLFAAAVASAEGRRDLAVLGGVSGSFPALAQVRWPPRPLRFIAAMDADPAGEHYLAQIQSALAGRPLAALSATSAQVAS